MQVKRLSEIALTQPHVAYSAFTHGLSCQWSYISRTVENISSMMQPLEEAIRDYFIPAITGQQHCSQDVRDLLALPCRLGGLNLTNPTHTSDVEFKSSCRITAPLAALIIQQEQCYNVAVEAVQKEKSATKFEKRASQKQALVELEANCPVSMKRCVELASEKGASNWLSVLPVEEHGFHLSKGDFRDALCMRYGWMLPNLPSKCVCGSAFNVDHAMVCAKGGFPTLRHNEIRDITADLLTEVCHDVAIEPMLQPLTGEKFQKKTANMSDEARLDLSARGVWTKGDRAFFDVRVFYPNARSNSQGSLRSAFDIHECGKNVNMRIEYWKWNMPASLCWFFSLPVAWALKLPPSTNILPV